MIVSFLLYMYTPIYTTSSQRVATYLDIPSLEGTEGTCVQGRVLLGPPTREDKERNFCSLVLCVSQFLSITIAPSKTTLKITEF